MDLLEFLSRFAVALGIGLLIGLERGWRLREMKPGTRAAGIRTFAISSLLGATAAAVAQSAADTGFFLGSAFVAFAAVITLFCWEENRTTGSNSATTAIAAVLTFSLGAFTIVGDVMRRGFLPRAKTFTAGSRASPGPSCARHWCCWR